MIHYDVLCECQHQFDGWFASSDGFDDQVSKNLVQCPVCGSHNVEKALMTPGVPARSNRRTEPVAALHAPCDPKARAMVEMIRKLRSHVEANADYVGDKFAESARRIHYGEEEQRGIYGEATIDEARELHDEGVEVLPLPKLPEDGN